MSEMAMLQQQTGHQGRVEDRYPSFEANSDRFRARRITPVPNTTGSTPKESSAIAPRRTRHLKTSSSRIRWSAAITKEGHRAVTIIQHHFQAHGRKKFVADIRQIG